MTAAQRLADSRAGRLVLTLIAGALALEAMSALRQVVEISRVIEDGRSPKRVAVVDAEPPASPPAGDPSSPFAGDDLAAADE